MVEMPRVDWPAYPQLARALRDCVDAILGRWIEKVSRRLVTADRLTHTQLRDHLPLVLRALADALESSDIDPRQAMAELASNHGAERFHESYSVDDLLIEFGMLRPIVIDEIASLLSRTLHLDELTSLNHGLDAAMRHSVDRFVLDQSRQIQSVNEAHAKYLAYMSHDLRGGLNGVLLMADLISRSLRKDEAARESAEDLASMRASILETMQAMEAFLQAERLRRGNVKPNPVRSNLADCIRRAVVQFPVQAGRRGIQLKTEIEADVTAEIDRDLLNLILTNILSNAVRHSPPASTIRVVLRLADRPDFAQISVIDKGPGVSPHRQIGLFRAPARSVAEQGPTGTGLLTAGHAADLMSVGLSVDSVPGSGATFHVVIPLNANHSSA